MACLAGDVEESGLRRQLNLEVGARPHPLKLMRSLWLVVPGMLLVQALFELMRRSLRLRVAHSLRGHFLVHISVWRLLDRERPAQAIQLLRHPRNSVETVHFLRCLHLLEL